MASISQDQIDLIESLWGTVNFDFKEYTQIWYHRPNGRAWREKEEIEAVHKRATNTLEKLIFALTPPLTFSPGDAVELRTIGMDICDWNIAYPLDITHGAFSYWLLAARFAKRQENGGVIDGVRKEDWERLRTCYLKVKDLQLQSNEDSEEDWKFLAKFKQGNRMLRSDDELEDPMVWHG